MENARVSPVTTLAGPVFTPSIETQTPLRIEETRPILRIGDSEGSRLRWISKGKPGSLQTAAEMASLVRAAAVRDEGLHSFAALILRNNNLDSHSDPDEVIDALFRYVQKIQYVHDPSGAFDSIQDARQTIKRGVGDCDDLSVLLATLLALVGFRPRFVLARYAEDSSGYDHIYVDVPSKSGRVALDPSTRTQGMGWESPKAIERIAFPIFSGDLNSLSDNAQANQTIAQLLAAVGGMFQRGAANRALTDARDANAQSILQQMRDVKAMVERCEITQAEGASVASELVRRYYAWCDASLPSSIASSCRNYEREDAPGQPQYGAFRYHTAQINTAIPSCNGPVEVGGQTSGGGSGGQPVAGGSGPGGLPASAVYLLGGGALLLMYLMRSR